MLRKKEAITIWFRLPTIPNGCLRSADCVEAERSVLQRASAECKQLM